MCVPATRGKRTKKPTRGDDREEEEASEEDYVYSRQ